MRTNIFARGFLAGFLHLPEALEDKPIEPKSGDIFLGLDLQPVLIPKEKTFNGNGSAGSKSAVCCL